MKKTENIIKVIESIMWLIKWVSVFFSWFINHLSMYIIYSGSDLYVYLRVMRNKENKKEIKMTLKEYIEKKETELKEVEKRPEFLRNGLLTIDDKLDEMDGYYDEELIREVGGDSYGEGYYDELKRTITELKEVEVLLCPK